MNIILLLLQQPIAVSRATRSAKNTARFLMLIIACLVCFFSRAQQKKSSLQLADQYFAAGEYYTAAHLYEQFLHPPKNPRSSTGFPLNSKTKLSDGKGANASHADVLYKQAESYRLANYWQDAALTYKKCIDNGASHFPDAFYWYAVCERSLGHYDTAKASIQQYLSLSTGNTQYKDAAEKELQTLSYIGEQLARPDSFLFRTRKLGAPNSADKGVFALGHINGNQFLVSSTQKIQGETKGTNPYHSRLFSATLTNGSLEKMNTLGIDAADPMINQGAASVSPNGKYLYFSQWEKENGKTMSSIYYSVKDGSGWTKPALLPAVNGNGYNSKQPFCTSDGKYLYFASDRPGSVGKFDIWYASLKKDGTPGEPVNAGPSINSSDDEQAPYYQNSSSTLVFSSNRSGMGGYDLFSAKGSETNWSAPENLGYPVNSSRDDIYFFAAEKSPLLASAILGSDRGEGCCLESYNIIKAPKNKRLTGMLRDCKDNQPLGDAKVTLKTVSGKTFTATTNADGTYSFELGNEMDPNLTLAFDKLLYNAGSTPVSVQNTDESDLLTDKLTNKDACIEKRPEPKAVGKFVIKAENVVTVYFDFDKSNLKPQAVERLDSIYNILSQNKTATIQISGYTDGIGTDAYNKVLSDKRARACADYLIQKGIESGRVSFVSFGACCPVEMEKINGRDNPDGRSRNRRALINVDKE